MCEGIARYHARPLNSMKRPDLDASSVVAGTRATVFRATAMHDMIARMTDDDLIAFALSLPETAEGSHFGTRDFRVRGKIFMTLPGPDFCVVKLTPDQQQMALATMSEHVAAVPGGWGLKGSTRLFHRDADSEAIAMLVRRAWRNVAPKSLALPED